MSMASKRLQTIEIEMCSILRKQNSIDLFGFFFPKNLDKKKRYKRQKRELWVLLLPEY